MFDVCQNEPRTAKILAKAKTRAFLEELDEFVRSQYVTSPDDSDDSFKDIDYPSGKETDSDSSESEGPEIYDYHLPCGSSSKSQSMKNQPKAPKHARGGKRRKLNLDQEENPSARSKLKKFTKTTTLSLEEDQRVLQEKQTGNAYSPEKACVNGASSFKNFHLKFKSGKENEHPTVGNCSVERPFKNYIANSGSTIETCESRAEVKSSVIEGSISDSQVVKKSTPVTICSDSRIRDESAQHSSHVSGTGSCVATPNSSLTKPTTFEKSDSAKSVQPCPLVSGESSKPRNGENHPHESSFKDFVLNSETRKSQSKATSLLIDDSFSDLSNAQITSTPVASVRLDSGFHEESPAVAATVSHAVTPDSSLTKLASLEKTGTSSSSIPVKSGEPISESFEKAAGLIKEPISVFTARLERSENKSANENSDLPQPGCSPAAGVSVNSSAILETSSVNNFSRSAASASIASALRPTGAHSFVHMSEGSSLSGDWVREQLKKTQDGKGILQWYKNRGSLNSRKRSLLVTILIKKEVDEDPSKVISTERFVAMAQAICECFPREVSSTYYTPRHRNKFNKVFRAKGKLYDKWINARRNFRAENIIIGRRNLQPEEAPELSDTEDSECTEVQLMWTKTRSEYPEAIPYFTATCRARIKEFLQTGPNRSIAEFLKKYPAYLKENGHLLIEQEFNVIYPGKGDNFLKVWPQFATKIIDFAFDKQTYSSDFRRTLISHKIDLTVKDENGRAITALHLLVLLLPSMTAFRHWRISRYEAKNAFLLCTQTSKEASTTLAMRKLRLAEFNIPAPPTPVIVGGSDSNACIDDIVYPCGSPLAALDICCKLLFLLKADLPPDSHLAILFVKAYLYGIEPDMAEEYQGVCTLKNDLNL